MEIVRKRKHNRNWRIEKCQRKWHNDNSDVSVDLIETVSPLKCGKLRMGSSHSLQFTHIHGYIGCPKLHEYVSSFIYFRFAL